MYDNDKPNNKIPLLLNITCWGVSCSRDLMNRNTILTTFNIENTNINKNIVSILRISFSSLSSF
jgi:hypothetical protein